MSEEVTQLIAKAAKAETADNAMKFSQAANNSANALLTLDAVRKSKMDE